MGEQNKMTAEEIKKEAFSFVTRFTPPFDVLSYESFKDIVFEAFVYGFEFSAQETAALREELEEVNERLSFYKRVNENNIRLHDKISEELEAVKKEKDEFDSKIMELMIHHEKQLSEVTRQRNEQNELLSEIMRETNPLISGEGRLSNKLRSKLAKHVSRLSSGETKPVQENERGEFQCPVCETGTMYPLTNKPGHFCPYCKAEATPSRKDKPVSHWISVEDRLPEYGILCDIIIDGETSGIGMHNGKKWFGKTWDWDFLRQDQKVTNWMPLPQPPESLTDKSRV